MPVPAGHIWCLGSSCWLIWSSRVPWDVLLSLRACYRAGSLGVWASDSARWLILPEEPTRPTPCITLKNKYEHIEREKAAAGMHPPTCTQPSAELPVLHARRARQAGEVLNHSPSHPASCWGPSQREVCACGACLCPSRVAAQGAELSNLVILVFACTRLPWSCIRNKLTVCFTHSSLKRHLNRSFYSKQCINRF